MKVSDRRNRGNDDGVPTVLSDIGPMMEVSDRGACAVTFAVVTRMTLLGSSHAYS